MNIETLSWVLTGTVIIAFFAWLIGRVQGENKPRK